jgi:hypothetical protein
MPPTAVLGWAGLTEDQADALAEMNDNGAKFHEIVKHIRATL